MKTVHKLTAIVDKKDEDDLQVYLRAFDITGEQLLSTSVLDMMDIRILRQIILGAINKKENTRSWLLVKTTNGLPNRITITSDGAHYIKFHLATPYDVNCKPLRYPAVTMLEFVDQIYNNLVENNRSECSVHGPTPTDIKPTAKYWTPPCT